MLRLWLGLAVLLSVSARQTTRTLKSDHDFELFESFCFLPSADNAHPEVSINVTASAGHKVAVYNPQAWADASRATKCKEKLDKSTFIVEKFPWSQTLEKEVTVPQFWYFAAACCDCSEGISITIEPIKMFNPAPHFPSFKFNREFSGEEMGLAVMFVVFAIIFASILALHLYARSIHQAHFPASAGHVVSHLATLTLCLQFATILCAMLHYCVYGNTGAGSPTLNALSDVFEVMFESGVITLGFALATGLAFGECYLRRAPLRRRYASIILVLVTYCSLYTLLLTSRKLSEPEKYLFDSNGGLGVNSIRFIVAFVFALMFRYRVRESIKEECRRAYQVVGTAICMWLAFLAMLTISGTKVGFVDRHRYLSAAQLILNIMVSQAIVWVSWPTVARQVLRVRVEGEAQGSGANEQGEGDEVEALNPGRADDGL